MRQGPMKRSEPVAEVDPQHLCRLGNREKIGINFLQAEFFGGDLLQPLRGNRRRVIDQPHGSAALRVCLHQTFGIPQCVFMKAPGVLARDAAIFHPDQAR